MLALLSPVADQIPATVEFRQVLAISLLIAVCFIVGLIVRTGPGLRAKNAFERSVLEKLLGYTFLRGLAGRLTGRSEEHTLQPALVEIEEALVPALIVEKLADGSGLDGLYYTGRRPTINGNKGESNENARVGLTCTLPIDKYKLYQTLWQHWCLHEDRNRLRHRRNRMAISLGRWTLDHPWRVDDRLGRSSP